jgi:pyruvate/2-oxoglutarate dehydrogenase complex dihydrolipoamide dehydrogenase (E3) component
VANLFDGEPRCISARIPCYALFIDLALGRVCMTETEALASGRRALRARIPMQRVGRAREAGESQGFMKVLLDADTQRLLGAAILGMNGDEVVHSLVDIRAADQPVQRHLAVRVHSFDRERTGADAAAATQAGLIRTTHGYGTRSASSRASGR